VCAGVCQLRTLDIFRDWDEDNDGNISRSEFRKAMAALGVEGGRTDHDALFDLWDVDSSG
jgi:Ca2+-binding EF-hand superfamily protein